MKGRLEWHNEGPCGYTTAHRPWRLIVQIEFCDEPTARRFERYLKSGSGRAFAKRHFAPTKEHRSRYAIVNQSHDA
jgi:predicted GIY-YIG superfamily endonuclease